MLRRCGVIITLCRNVAKFRLFVLSIWGAGAGAPRMPIFVHSMPTSVAGCQATCIKVTLLFHTCLWEGWPRLDHKYECPKADLLNLIYISMLWKHSTLFVWEIIFICTNVSPTISLYCCGHDNTTKHTPHKRRRNHFGLFFLSICMKGI